MKRIPALDGVRALAVLLVLLGHYARQDLLALLGVKVFFVLSGFLITRLLVAEYREHGRIAFGRFYARRAFRIVPAYYLFLAITFAIAWRGQWPYRPVEVIGAWTYTLNYVIALAAHPEASAILHAWSLAVEEQFYFIWPLVLSTALTHGWVRRVLVLAIVAVLGWRLILLMGGVPPTYLRVAFDTRAAILATGCLLAVLPAMRPRGILTLICLGLLIASTLRPLAGLGYAASDAIDGTLIAILLAQSMAWHPHWMGHAGLRWLADRSYAMYLWHLWGLVLAARLTGQPVVQGVVGLLATLALATWSYHVVERPALRLRDRLADRHESAATSTPVTGSA